MCAGRPRAAVSSVAVGLASTSAASCLVSSVAQPTVCKRTPGRALLEDTEFSPILFNLRLPTRHDASPSTTPPRSPFRCLSPRPSSPSLMVRCSVSVDARACLLHPMRTWPLIVLLSSYYVEAQVRVRIWQPNIDSSKIKEPIRFWELVEMRPTSSTPSPPPSSSSPPTTITTSRHHETTATTTTSTSTTTTTTTTTTTPAPTTVEWVTQTTQNPCGETDPWELVKTMKDSGIYNEIYMAPDIFTASRNFPDLAGKSFMKAKSRYHCDEKCERSSKLVRMVMTGDETPPLPKESERAWWNEDEWKRERRSILSPLPSRTERRKELEHTVRTALRELERMDRDEVEASGERSEQEEFDRFFTSELHNDSLQLPRKKRSSSESELTEINSGTAKDILGTTIALDCHDKREDLQAGYQLCSSCRAVRHLPHSYFPRILNEIICGESTCVRGDGRCAQRFLPLKILHNEGTDLCPKWRLVSIDLRTCCDCVIHPFSPFVRYIHRN